MELNSGICGICDSEAEIINPEDSGTFWETICGIFKDELENLLILKSELKICPTCIFHARLIDTKKDIFKNEVIDVDSTSVNKCRFCKDNICVLKVENSEFLKKFEFCQKFKGKGWSIICASCYYVIRATVDLRTNLICKLSKLNKSSSIANDGLHSIDNEAGSSSCETNTLTKPRRNSVEENNLELLEKTSSDLYSEDSNEEKPEKNSKDYLETKAEKDEKSEESDPTTSPKKLKNQKFNSIELLSHLDISKKEIETEQYVLISDDDLILDTKKNRRSRNKTFRKTLTPCDDIEKSNKEESARDTGIEHSCSSKEELKQSAVDSPLSLDCLNYSHKISRKRKPCTSPDKESAPRLKKPHALLTPKVNGLDISRISSLTPLSKTNVNVSDVIRQDAKFYSLIPYVKVTTPEKIEKSEKKDGDILEHIWTKRPCTSPTGIIKRTPPIKIKLKKITKFKKEKKKNRKNAVKVTSPTNSTMFDEFKKKKVIVKVERMKLPTQEEIEFVNKANFNEIEPKLNNMVEAYEPGLKDTSAIEVTPKKKKKVHFNDTPTIIITGDEMSEDLDSTIEDEEISKKNNTRNGKTMKYEEKKPLLDEENIEIDSDEGEVEVILPEEEGKKESTKKEEIIELLDQEEEKSKFVEIEITDDEEPEELATKCEPLVPVKECTHEVIEKENVEIKESPDEAIEASAQIENEANKNDSECETGTAVKDQSQEDESLISLEESTGETEESNNLIQQTEHEEEKHVVEEKSDSVEIIEDETESVTEKGVDVEDKSELDKSIDVEKKNAVQEKSGGVIEGNEIENTEKHKENTVLNKDSGDEYETEDRIDGLQVVDECCDEELEEGILEDGDKNIVSETGDTEEFSGNGDMAEVEKKDDDDLDADKIVVNDIVLSEATTASEDFGSLIDEVQKCLTSTKDLSSESTEDPVLELHASTDEIDKVFEKDDSLSCLNDIDRGLDSSFAENLIDDDKTSNLETDLSSLDKGIKRALSAEDDDTEKSVKNPKSGDSN